MVFKFSLDQYINPYIPPSILPRIPRFISRWLGYRHGRPERWPDYILWLDILIGTYIGLLTIEGIFKSSYFFQSHHAPIIMASYGAASVLLFNANESPLAQPRNVIFGQIISSTVSIGLLKIFQLTETGQDHLYLGAPLATAISSVITKILDCVHPPSGSTALIPFIDHEIAKMGWWYILAHLISSAVMIGVALIANNVFRSYPLYWWTKFAKKDLQDKCEETNVGIDDSKELKDLNQIEPSHTSSTLIDLSVSVSKYNIKIPETLKLDEDELQLLESIREKLLKIQLRSQSHECAVEKGQD